MLEAAKDLVEERVGLLSVMRAPATASQRAREESDAVEEKQQRATREGFALGRVVWFGCEGDYGRDFCFHVANGHTLVSLLRGHSMHPFERFDRACYLACVPASCGRDDFREIQFGKTMRNRHRHAW